jgi:predicted AlkP superfamily pyrophosphatase or phosphodiesterase
MKPALVLLALAACLLGIPAPVPARAQPAAPKLVVVLVVDQMRADYLERYAGLLEHGL